MVSREMGSRPRCVILTVRNAVFIWGETEVIVPWMIVPFSDYQYGEARVEIWGINVPFLSSIVTVSFAHFIKNLPRSKRVSV
jgi:hypothetical protein